MSVDLICFPLPTGRTGTTGRCSVLLAPRLRTSAALSTYPDWSNWPSALAGLTFQVRVNGAVVPSSRVSANPSPAIWSAVFPPTTPVEAHEFIDRRQTDLVSYPAVSLEQGLADAFGDLANQRPNGPASFNDLSGLNSVSSLLSNEALSDVERYTGTVGNLGAPPVEIEAPDFHGWLTLVAAHPALMRALGLVIDFQANLNGVAGGPTSVQIVSNYTTIPGRRAAHLTMRTTTSFLGLSDPEKARKAVEQGWLRCADENYRFAPGGGDQLALELSQMQRQEGDDADDPNTGGLPASRGGGLSLYRENTAEAVQARFERQVELEGEIEDVLTGAEPTAELWAEDVVAGYRFDIRDDTTNTWRSLYQRTPDGAYEFPRNPSLNFTPPPDEGMQVFTLSADGHETSTTTVRQVGETQVRTTAKSGEQRVSPNVVSWNGWSKAAAPPRRVFDTITGAVVDKPEPEPGTDAVRLALSQSATPASLPRLRFGWTYLIRGRAVDIAGNSLPPPPAAPAPPAEAPSNPAFYGRPAIPRPTMLRNEEPPVPGAFESALSLVLRSDYDIDDNTVAPTERMVFPPQTDQYTCEQHSLPAGGVDPASYAVLAERDAASLDDDATRADDGELLWGEFVGPAFVPGAGAPEVPYLPDPATEGLTLANVPGAADPVQVAWNGAWPARLGGRLIVRAGGKPPTTRPAADVLAELWVPKAVQTTVELSCYPSEDMVDTFTAWPLLATNARRNEARQGLHTMFSSRLRVNLVHAVRRPLAAPLAGTLTADRQPAGTAARITGPVTLDLPSTGSLNVRATWTETIDDPNDPAGPQPVEHAARTHESYPSLDHRLRLNTTKRAALSVELDAISAFVDYFLEEKTLNLFNVPTSLDPAGVVGSKVTVIRNGERLIRGQHYELDEAAGTIRRMVISGIPIGTSVTVRYVARPVLRASTEHGAAGVSAVLAPSSLAPPPPVIVDVVPAFSTRTRATGQRIDVSRNGASIRVWLARPWLESGDGERLAIVLDPSGDRVRTSLARDPGAFGGGPATPLGPTSFPAAASVEGNVDGRGDAVATHDVRYDADRQRWASDIELRGNLGYRPWIRLALARYQPDAIQGAHLSPIEFPQPLRLGPDREVSVRRTGRRITVVVTGSDHDGVPDGSGGRLYNAINVQAQVADATISDPDLAWTDAEAPITLDRPRRGRWNGELFPTGDLLSGAPVRLVITETEPVPAHSGVGVEQPVIYVETVEIPEAWIPSGPGLAPGQP